MPSECSSSSHCLAGPARAVGHTARTRSVHVAFRHNRHATGPTSPSSTNLSSRVAACCNSKQPEGNRQRAGHSDIPALSRRNALLAGILSSTLLAAQQVQAFQAPPPGFRLQRDKLDGYSFLLPETWTPLSSSGNDIFYRNPYNVNENLFVNISSPSSSRYSSVEDLQSPQAAAERTLRQYLEELMSTRLGVKRTGNVVSASERRAPDGKLYYDLQLEAKSYASRNQLAVSQKQIDAAMELEWERRYITVLGVANKRLYEFRLQTAKDTYDEAKDTLLGIAQSFRCTDLEA